MVKLLTHEVLVDPYPTYTLLRETDPVHWDEQLHGWVLTRYEHVAPALRDHGVFSSRRLDALVASRGGTAASPEMVRFVRLSSEWMWMLDPPQHTRLRALMGQGFTPRAIRELAPMVDEIVHDLVDTLLDRGEFDLVNDFSHYVPALVMVDLFALPRADAAMITAWCDLIKIFVGGASDLGAAGPPAAAALGEMIDYLADVVRARTRSPGDDLVSRIVRARDGEHRLGHDELVSNLLLLLLAGFETTIDMIGNGLHGLLTQRSQWELLKSDPALIPGAVEEILRYDGTVQLTHRVATSDVTVAGTEIKQGQLVYLVRGSANRDPARFPDPDRIDVTRAETGQLGLGLGIHYCLGAGLAKMEGAAALAALTKRIPDLALHPDQPARWRADNIQFRGLAALPATVGGTP